MGHDIYGFKNHGKPDETEVAYLRRSAFNSKCFEIYNALDAQDCNGFSSGNGDGRLFSEEKLKRALAYLKDEEDLEPERKFIADCLANLDENGQIYVGFY